MERGEEGWRWRGRGDGGGGRQAAGFELRRRAKRGSEREDPAWSGPCGPQQIKWMCFMGLVRECGPLAIPMGFDVWAASVQGYRERSENCELTTFR